MTIQGKCHGCGALLKVPSEFAGRVAKCPKCGAKFKVPAAATQAGAAVSTAAKLAAADDATEIIDVGSPPAPSSPKTVEMDDDPLALLEKVAADYTNVVVGDRSLGERVGPELFERRSLKVGAPAPDIAGQDVSGHEFKLSEYRGKVVLLMFWADWSSECEALYPQLRLLAEKFKDRPFVILGVNGDPRERLRTVTDLKQATWRSWSDGRGGKITERWNVQSLPMLYVLDPEGKIRFKALEPGDLESAAEQLLQEAEGR